MMGGNCSQGANTGESAKSGGLNCALVAGRRLPALEFAAEVLLADGGALVVFLFTLG